MDYLRRYIDNHRHPVNRLCHLLAVPALALSAAQTAFGWWLGWHTLGLALGGGSLLFAGHKAEGNRPVVWELLLEALHLKQPIRT